MNLNLTIGPIVALIAGILILVMPGLLRIIVAVYLIAIGIIGLLHLEGRSVTPPRRQRLPPRARRA